MSLARIQAKTGINTTFASDVSSTAFTSALTNPSLILVAWEGDANNANSANTPTDTAGNTYIKVLSKSVLATFDLEIWYALNTSTTASNVVRITDTGGGVDSTICVEEWTGHKTSSPTDGSSSNSGSVSPLTAGAFSTVHSNDVIFVGGCEAVGASDLTAGAGYSNLSQTNTTFTNIGICSQVGAAGSYNGTFTSSVGVSWACGAGAFQDTTVSAVTFLPRRMLMGMG